MSHYQALLVGFGVRGKALTEQLEAERRPHWEYEGREAELIEMTEKQAEQEGAKP